MDFSEIGNLRKTYDDARTKAVREQTLAQLGQGADVNAVANQLFRTGDVEGGLSLSRLGEMRAQRAQTQSNADRSFEEQRRQFNVGAEGGRIPAGWEKTPTGMRPITGGPEDPNYLRQKTEAVDKGRPMSITDITKLSEEGGKFANIGGFVDTFKPEFAGHISPQVGAVSNWAGRHLPESVVGETRAQSAAWWQQYDKFKNLVRNELYGASLQPSETALFEKSDVNAGMDPKQIKTNLETQRTIAENGLKRKANAMIAAGYKPDVIAKAYGLNLDTLGVSTNKNAVPPPQASAPKTGGPNKEAVQAARANQAATLEEARAALKANPANRDIIVYRLKQVGIDPAGL
jgi:hypothetical protein